MEGVTRAVSSCSDSLNCARRSLRVISLEVCDFCAFCSVCAGREAAPGMDAAAASKQSHARVQLRIALRVILALMRIIPSMIIGVVRLGPTLLTSETSVNKSAVSGEGSILVVLRAFDVTGARHGFSTVARRRNLSELRRLHRLELPRLLPRDGSVADDREPRNTSEPRRLWRLARRKLGARCVLESWRRRTWRSPRRGRWGRNLRSCGFRRGLPSHCLLPRLRRPGLRLVRLRRGLPPARRA